MNLLAHLVAADLRRFRWPILLWIVVHLVCAFGESVLPAGTDRSAARALGLAISLLRFTEAMFALALVAFVVQTHPTVGSNAFWMTRPIPWASLLASKAALLAVVLVGVPVAAEIVKMLSAHVPAGPLGLAALQMTLFRSVALLVVMAVAALTPNIAYFALASVSLVIGFAIVIAVGQSLPDGRDYVYSAGVRYYDASGVPERGVLGRDMSWLVVAFVVAAATALTLLAVQYRTRLLRRAIATGLAGFVVVMLVGWAWPWRFLSVAVAAPPELSSVDLAGDPSSVAVEPLHYGGDEPRFTLGWAHLLVNRVPTGWVASARLVRASFDYPAGRLSSPGHTSSVFLPFGDRDVGEAPLAATTREVLGVRMIAGNSTGPTGPRAIVFVGQRDDMERLPPAAGTYRGDFLVDMSRMEVAAVLPLQAGAVFQDGAYRLRVLEIGTSDGVRIRTRLTDVRTLFDRRPRAMYTYYLRNRGRAEASEASSYRGFDHLPFDIDPSSGFSAREGELFVPENYRDSEGGWLRINRAWLADAEIVVVRSYYGGSVPRSIELPGVKLR